LDQSKDGTASSTGTEPAVSFFDKHSWLLFIAATTLLLLYTAGLLLIWYGLTLGTGTAVDSGLYLALVPTELVILSAYTSKNRELAFGRVRIKAHPTWLLLNEVSRFVTSIDIMLAGVGAFVPSLLYFSPAVKPGVFTVNGIATLWASMAALAFFAVLYGRSLMQVLGLRYETFGGASLTGAAACAGLASFKFRNELKSGLDYLAASLEHVKSVLAARGSDLEAIDSARLAVRSMQDNPTIVPYGTLRAFSDQITVLPNLIGLPAEVDRFLSEIRWPNEIRPARRRVYGIEWIAVAATVSAAIVGLVASLIQASGQGPLTQAILSSSTAYFVSAAVVFFLVVLVGFRSSGYSVQTRDIDAYEKDIIRRYKESVGSRTSIRSLSLIPEALVATGSAVLAFIAGFFLVGTAILSVWYRGILSLFPVTIFVFALVLFLVFFLLAYTLVRDLWHTFRPKPKKAPVPPSASSSI
jgi:hypothetical protein